MDKCAYCYQPLYLAEVSGLAHDAHVACEDECQRRLNDETCTRCGRNNVGDLPNVYCKECGKHSKYFGYPGPG